jgi:hypothetical protein
VLQQNLREPAVCGLRARDPELQRHHTVLRRAQLRRWQLQLVPARRFDLQPGERLLLQHLQ